MSVLRNTSVRAILGGVFLILAAGLCTSLGWQLYGAWALSDEAERVAALARTDKTVFKANYDIRLERTDLQTFLMSREDFAAAVHETEVKAQKAYDAGIASVEATPGID